MLDQGPSSRPVSRDLGVVWWDWFVHKETVSPRHDLQISGYSSSFMHIYMEHSICTRVLGLLIFCQVSNVDQYLYCPHMNI